MLEKLDIIIVILFRQKKNIIFNKIHHRNRIDGSPEKHKVHEADARVIHSTKLLIVNTRTEITLKCLTKQSPSCMSTL